MKKILILGSTGMAGHIIYDYLSNIGKYELYNLAFRNALNSDSIICDVSDQNIFSKLLFDLKPEIVINCIGVLIKGSNQNHANAIYINAYLPHFINQIIKQFNCKLIHLSTDCVFSGNKGNYLENDFKDANDIYGRSKSLGEVIDDKNLTLRTSIIGPELKTEGEGLLSWILKQEGQIRGFTHAFWSGITTLELAKFIDYSIENELTGLVHVTNNLKISKFDLLTFIIQTHKLYNIKLVADSLKHIDKSILNTRNDIIYNIPSYERMISEQYNYMVLNCKRYQIFMNNVI